MKNKLVAGFLCFLFASNAYCSTYVVYGTKIDVYAQSESSGGTAHLIQSSKGIYNETSHPWCGYRAYIDMSDKALFTAALAASSSQRPVNFIYDDAAASRYIANHTTSKCKVISIFSGSPR